MTSSQSVVEQRISEPADHPKKFAGLLDVLLVGQFARGMFGIECFVWMTYKGSTLSPIITPFISA